MQLRLARTFSALVIGILVLLGSFGIVLASNYNNCVEATSRWQDWECTPVIDVCPNIDSVQAELPEGYEVNENKECVEIPVDVCPNIEGVQTEVPEGQVIDDDKNCVDEPEPETEPTPEPTPVPDFQGK